MNIQNKEQSEDTSMTLSVNKDNKKSIKPEIMNLLKTHFSEYIMDNERFKIEMGENFKNNKTGIPSVSLCAGNLEKICFAVGPGKIFKKNPYLVSENYIEDDYGRSKPVDFAYKIIQNEVPKYLGFIENKIITKRESQNPENLIRCAIDQLYLNYIAPLKKSSEKESKNAFVSIEEERQRNFSVSVCVFNPKEYLNRNCNFILYCDDKDSDLQQRLYHYGFVMLTVFVNINTINSKEGLQVEFDKFFKKDHESLCWFVPNLYMFQGYIQKDVHDSMLNTTVTMTFEELKKLPFYNVNSSSRITNTRDLVEDSLDDKGLKDNKLKVSILETLLKNFKSKESKENPTINKSETDRSLGAKNREVSFSIEDTIVVLDRPDEFNPHAQQSLDETKDDLIKKRMEQKSYYLTCNMSLIDGQHSSRHIISYIEAFSKGNNTDNEYINVAKKVYQDKINLHPNQRFFELFDTHKFYHFLQSHFITVAYKGFSLEVVAQQAAANQNNIRKQSKVDQITNKEREKVAKLSNFYNRLDKNLKLKFNKSAWVNRDFIPNNLNLNLVNPDKLTHFAGVWSQKSTIWNNDGEINHLIGRSNTHTNSLVGDSYEKSIDWFFKVDSDMKELEDKVNEILILYKDNDSGERLTESNKKRMEQLRIFWKNKKTKLSVFEEVEENLNTALILYKDNEIQKSMTYLDKLCAAIVRLSVIYEKKLINALDIYEALRKFKGDKNAIPFFNQIQGEPFFYIINYFNLLLMKNMIQAWPGEEDLLEKVNSNDIKQTLKQMELRLKKAEDKMQINGFKFKQLNIGKKEKMNEELFDVLFN